MILSSKYTIIIFVIMLSCTSDIPSENESVYDYENFNRHLAYDEGFDKFDTFDRYLIPFFIDDRKTIDTVWNSYYSYFLTGFREESLLNEPSTVRFLLIQTWTKPIMIKICKQFDNTRVELKILNGNGSYSGIIESVVIKNVSSENWNSIIDSLSNGFWKMNSGESFTGGSDGGMWLIEANINSKYHIVERWTPSCIIKTRDTHELVYYEKLCYQIMEMAKINTDSIYYGFLAE